MCFEMKSLLLYFVLEITSAADVINPSSCKSFPCKIFEDNFDFLDHDIWEHEITLSGGGNWEFQAYVNNRSVSFVRNSTLYIKPQLTSDWRGEKFLTSGELNVWGMNGRNDVCTSNSFFGCQRKGTSTHVVNPVLSARLRTLYDFSFRYGRVEVVAKMPRGQWLWPAVWMLPQYFRYGGWPASGEIDIVEARGNDIYGNLSNQFASSTLHWGPYGSLNRFPQTSISYTPKGDSFTDAFHTWAVEWTPDSIAFCLDDEILRTIDPGTNFWDFGNFISEGDIDNPWIAGSKMAPFDQPFYLIINLAVGGVVGYFPDDVPSDPAKPWLNSSPAASTDFWKGRELWLPSWQDADGKISDDAALQVDKITVYKTAPDQIAKTRKFVRKENLVLNFPVEED